MFFMLWIGNRFQEGLIAIDTAYVFQWTGALSRDA
jgi:hypothetical protein